MKVTFAILAEFERDIIRERTVDRYLEAMGQKRFYIRKSENSNIKNYITDS